MVFGIRIGRPRRGVAGAVGPDLTEVLRRYHSYHSEAILRYSPYYGDKGKARRAADFATNPDFKQTLLSFVETMLVFTTLILGGSLSLVWSLPHPRALEPSALEDLAAGTFNATQDAQLPSSEQLTWHNKYYQDTSSDLNAAAECLFTALMAQIIAIFLISQTASNLQLKLDYDLPPTYFLSIISPVRIMFYVSAAFPLAGSWLTIDAVSRGQHLFLPRPISDRFNHSRLFPTFNAISVLCFVMFSMHFLHMEHVHAKFLAKYADPDNGYALKKQYLERVEAEELEEQRSAVEEHGTSNATDTAPLEENNGFAVTAFAED